MWTQTLSLCCSLALAGGLAAAPAAPSAEKLRKALDQVKDLEVVNQGLGSAVEMLSKQSGVPLAVDPALAQGGMASPEYPLLTVRGSRVKVGEALDRALAPHGLARVILGGQVVVSTAERATHLALRQRV